MSAFHMISIPITWFIAGFLIRSLVENYRSIKFIEEHIEWMKRWEEAPARVETLVDMVKGQTKFIEKMLRSPKFPL